MASWLSFFFGLPDVPKRAPTDRPKPRILPIRDNGLNPKLPDTPKLPALKNWSHPFKDSRDTLQQLTHMAKAAAGYYPLGRNGMFHGGVHFDGGTAGTLDQSSVHCLADGEVVAYRVDSRSPTTRYFVEGITVDVPFSRNFVLVRHHLQAPHITGSPDVPPSLTFYSLYLHLQDWAVYQDNRAQARPPFWPQSSIRRVKQTANDGRPGHPEETGLNVRNADYQGKVIDLLPRGTEVVVSGKGYYRKLENRLGPSALLDADGALRGYIAASLLRPEADGEHRIVSSRERVNVRAEPDISSEVLLELPTGSVLRVSGEGDFRKLERVNQYLYFAELESEPAPQAVDQIVVLEQPVPIKAGALIGHIGDYQDGYVERPEQRLHLEVFSGDDIDLYFEASRAWAQRLPAKEKTWLKLAKGTAVVPHRDDVTGPLLRTWSETSPLSDADLLIPRSLLDSLPAEKKFHVPGRDGRNDRRWYRLDGLLHDAEQNLLNGWVCEEVGVTPTVSPWAWEGYDVLFDYSTPRHNTASFFSVIGEFTEAQCQRFKPLADNDNAGPMKQRLYDIIDRNRDGHITGDELQAALQLPAHAQAISQMVLRKESEWFYTREKWDGVDELMGHCGSTPELNWVAEKQRIEQPGWWSEVAERVGLPSWGIPYHFHPIGLLGAFSQGSKELWILGTTSEYYESGGRGPGVVSTGRGDHGGVSYGVYQMSSKMGVVQDFIESSGYTRAFSGLVAGTAEFNDQWRNIAARDSNKFRDAQHEYIKKTHYDVQIKNVLSEIGFPVENKSAALHDLVWSTSVQFGPRTRLVRKALDGFVMSSASASEIICAVQDYKILNNSKLFESSPALQSGLLARAMDEKRKLLDLEKSRYEVK